MSVPIYKQALTVRLIEPSDRAAKHGCETCPRSNRKPATHGVFADAERLSEQCEWHAHALRRSLLESAEAMKAEAGDNG